MKTKMILFLFYLFFMFSYAIGESVFAKVNDKSVEIWNTGIEENCAFDVEFNVSAANDTIIVIEHDKSVDHVTCSCEFELYVTLKGLDTGHYDVIVYRQYSVGYMNPDTLYFIGKTSFTFNQPPDESFSFLGRQSLCNEHLLAIEDFKNTIPVSYMFLNSFPNPFNPKTKITYSVPFRAKVNIKIYDINGREISTLLDAVRGKGEYSLVFNGEKLNSGVYLCRYSLDNKQSKSIKILLVK